MPAFKVSADIIGDFGSVGDVIGDANKDFNETSYKLFHKNISLAGRTRAEKFLHTISGFTKGGSQVGAFTATVAFGVPDLVLGQGTKNPTCYDIRSEGVAGLVLHGAIDGVSAVSTVPGAIVGGVVGVVVEPASPAPFGTAICKGGEIGGNVLSCTTSVALSLPVGMVLGIARLPILLTKSLFMFVGGAAGAVIGFIGGSFRAMFNV
jgi:hypothetical protein